MTGQRHHLLVLTGRAARQSQTVGGLFLPPAGRVGA
jgi:hypothetical protein